MPDPYARIDRDFNEVVANSVRNMTSQMRAHGLPIVLMVFDPKRGQTAVITNIAGLELEDGTPLSVAMYNAFTLYFEKELATDE